MAERPIQTGLGLAANAQRTVLAAEEHDAFGRVRVSLPNALFDWTSQYGDDTNFSWNTAKNGSGGFSNVPAENAVRLTTGGTTSGDYAYRETRQYTRYQPGRSLNVETTFVCSAAATNARMRIGYFNASDGIFLERADSTIKIVRRTNVSGTPTDNPVAQSAWNVDKLDGTGTSGYTLNLTKANILFIQVQYLGVGSVQVGFVIDGYPVVAHQFLNANSLSTAYMTTGSLPVRGEVQNTGTATGTVTLDMICTSVSSGGLGLRTHPWSASNNVTAITTGTTLVPVISIRAATLFGGTAGGGSLTNRGHILLKSASILVTGQIHEYQLVLNGTLTSPSWAAVNAASIADVDVAASAITGGYRLEQGYLAASASTRSNVDVRVSDALPLVYSGLDSRQDILSLCARTVTGAGTAYGALNWVEEL